MGMAPPCLPNFLSKLSWTDTEEREEEEDDDDGNVCVCVSVMEVSY